jgi:hypothetical protein
MSFNESYERPGGTLESDKSGVLEAGNQFIIKPVGTGPGTVPNPIIQVLRAIFILLKLGGINRLSLTKKTAKKDQEKGDFHKQKGPERRRKNQQKRLTGAITIRSA